MAKKTESTAFSPWDDAATEGSDQQAVLTEIHWVPEFTYGGRYKDKPSTALFTSFDIQGFTKPWEDHWTIGPSDRYEVSQDGYTVLPLGTHTGLSRKSSGYFFFAALEKALLAQGLSRDEYVSTDQGLDVQALEGLHVRLVNAEFKDFGGDTKEKKVIGEIVLDAPAKTGRAARPSNGRVDQPNRQAAKTMTSRSNGEAIEDKAEAAIRAIIEDQTSVKTGDLANLVFQANRKDADVKAMMNLCFKDRFLAGLDGLEVKKGLLRAVED